MKFIRNILLVLVSFTLFSCDPGPHVAPEQYTITYFPENGSPQTWNHIPSWRTFDNGLLKFYVNDKKILLSGNYQIEQE